MRRLKFASALLMTMFLVSCGGGGSDIAAKPKFTAQVSFGDSLSDVGTYNVGTDATGGQFSINGPNANGKAANGSDIVNWTEVMAFNLGLPAPCPAVTGLNDGTGTPSGTNVAVETHAGCTGYAQGGARVTADAGIHNVLNNSLDLPGTTTLGGHELTYPVVTQIQNYLDAHNDSFGPNDIVYVMAGANDLSWQLNNLIINAVKAAIGAQIVYDLTNDVAAGTYCADPTSLTCLGTALAQLGGATYLKNNITSNAAAAAYLSPTGTAVPAAVTAMHVAGAQLAGYVNTMILGKHAKYVVVANLGDFASIPATADLSAETKGLITLMATTFNNALLSNLPSSPDILYYDLYDASQKEIENPAEYGLTNVTTQACDETATPNDRALFCNSGTLKAGLTADSRYLFADDQHPTPYGYALLAQGVLKDMTAKGWY